MLENLENDISWLEKTFRATLSSVCILRNKRHMSNTAAKMWGLTLQVVCHFKASSHLYKAAFLAAQGSLMWCVMANLRGMKPFWLFHSSIVKLTPGNLTVNTTSSSGRTLCRSIFLTGFGSGTSKCQEQHLSSCCTCQGQTFLRAALF